jgi:hypothetical protein
VDARSLVWLTNQLFHFHQFPCVLEPIPVGSCYVLPVSPGIDGSSRLIWNLSGSCLTVRKNIDVPTCVALLYILHYTSLNGIYFCLEYCGVEPKTEAVPFSQAPSIDTSTSAFIGLGPVYVPEQAPFVVWVEPSRVSPASVAVIFLLPSMEAIQQQIVLPSSCRLATFVMMPYEVLSKAPSISRKDPSVTSVFH